VGLFETPTEHEGTEIVVVQDLERTRLWTGGLT
jgi:hypothetical protein